MTALARKLQIKPGHKVLVLAAPPGFMLEGRTARGPFDVVLLFARDQAALARHAARATAAGGILWIAYPKTSSGVATDLTRDQGWAAMTALGYGPVAQVAIDATWSALRWKPGAASARRPARARRPAAPAPAPKDLLAAVAASPAARATWAALAPSHVREYVAWVTEARKPETRARRIARAIEMLAEGQRDRNARYRAAATAPGGARAAPARASSAKAKA